MCTVCTCIYAVSCDFGIRGNILHNKTFRLYLHLALGVEIYFSHFLFPVSFIDLISFPREISKVGDKKIYLFTSCGSHYSDDGLDQIVSGLKQHGIQLVVMYVSEAGPPLAQNDKLLSLVMIEDQTYKVMMVMVMVVMI